MKATSWTHPKNFADKKPNSTRSGFKKQPQSIYFNRTDNWHNVKYDVRYLDSLASIINIQSPCAAVAYLPSQNIYLLSYNENAEEENKETVKYLRSLIIEAKNDEGKKKLLLGLHVGLNPDFYQISKYLLSAAFTNSLGSELTGKVKGLTPLLNLAKRGYGTQILINIHDKYEELLKEIKQNPSGINEAQLELIIRPKQDVEKLISHLQDNQIIKFKILPNPLCYHAEINIALSPEFQRELNKNESGAKNIKG
ncbi:hypothetical protein phytr_10440 [Candidatus Phycorickettsia trachydisci]|uniref:Uncharacterized protein n=1 Tax=Candidatus Phycorickettsia trachydisci TaxID=2115978 RepID=A0A2P1P9M1_9RICK|nr:hypothetical protein [Candidatus Phycorickettsia trachydisci]AVP87972.1 hypothetical protein phytr_10440 [Candidatus Phycorickettsia trachydisci]